MTIEADASDDRVTRGRIRRSNLHLWAVVVVGSISVAGTTYQLARLLSRGGSIEAWRPALEGVLLFAIVIVPFTIAAVRLWVYVRSRQTGRLATCHACGHRWPLL